MIFQNFLLAAFALVFISLGVLQVRAHLQKRKEVQFPAVVRRTDLLYGYYACGGEQVAETKGHVNLFMESQFDGQDKAIQNILDASMTTVLDLSAQLFHRPENVGPFLLLDNAEHQLRLFFQKASNAGALRFVKYLYPIDEPNSTVGSLEVLTSAVNVARRVALEFPELAGVKFAVIYAADTPFIGQDMYDVVGFDEYGTKSSVLVGEKYKALKASLKPGQGIVIVPGGAYGQDPVPFINFANANPEVTMVMPFLWFDDTTGTARVPGIRSNGSKEAHIAAGMSVSRI